MTTAFYMFILFLAKVLDNTLNTAKTILVQRNRCLLAGVALGLSNFIYLSITKDIVTSDSILALVIVSIASGVGCCLAVALSNRFSKDRTYVNVILSDDKEAMKEFRGLEPEIHFHHRLCSNKSTEPSDRRVHRTEFIEMQESHPKELRTMVSTIEHFLARFHLADDVDTVFTNGCCYWFAVILHCRFPDSTLMYDQVENHFVTQIQGRLYDITGDVTEKYQVEHWDALDDELLKKRIVRDCILF